MSTYLEMADRALAMGRPDEAELLARRVLVHEPESPDALRVLAAALLDQGLRDEALDAARRAVSLRSDDWRIHLQLGRVLVSFEATPHLHAALAAARRASALAPDRAAPYALASSCFSALQRLRPARRALAFAARLDPDDPSVSAAMARLDLTTRRLRRAGSVARSVLDTPQNTVPFGADQMRDVVDRSVVEQVRDGCFALFVLIGGLLVMSSEGFDPIWRTATLVAFALAASGAAWWIRQGLPSGARYWPPGLLSRTGIGDRGLFFALPVLAGFAIAVGTVPDSQTQDVAQALVVFLLATGVLLFLVTLAEVGLAVRKKRRLPPTD